MLITWSVRAVFVTAGALSLLAIGLWHVLDGARTDRIFHDPAKVRFVGAVVLSLAVPCLVWRGWYFSTLGALLGASGALRLFAAERNVRLQKTAYPRWVHGWIMSAAAVALWILYVGWGQQAR
jgi:hypothetical protein